MPHSPALSPKADAAASPTEFFDAVAGAYLAGETTVAARAVTYAEIEALAAPDGPDRLTGYLLAEAVPGFTTEPTLTPAVFAIRRRSGTSAEVYGTKLGPGDRRVPDRTNVVGYRVDAEAHDAFRGVADLMLYTTPAAEEALDEVGAFRPASGHRDRFFVADEHATQVPLTPFFGSYATVSFAVPGVTPGDLAAHMQAVLERDFGVGAGRVARVRTSAVEDRRVDVTDAEGRLVAVHVLAAEVPNLMAQAGQGLTVRPSAGRGVVIGD